MPHLEQSLTTINSKIQMPCIHLFLINHLVNYYIFHPRISYLKTFNSELSYIEVWFTDQNSKPLQIEYKLNITLVFN